MPFLSSAERIKENLELRHHKIENVEVYEIPSRSKTYKIQVAKISFHTQTLPTKVVIGGEVMKVKPYIPTPMQCKNCWRFRHTAKKCAKKMEGVSHCVKCGETNHTLQECRKAKKCMNCSGPHYSNSRTCPHYDYHTAITEMWEIWGMPFYKAKQYLREEGLYPNLTYAGAATTETAAVPPIRQKHIRKQQEQQQQQQEKEQESVETLDETFLSIPDSGETTLLAPDGTKNQAAASGTIKTMRTAATTVVAAIQREAKAEETRVNVTAIQSLDTNSTSPVDNFGEPYLSMEAASESLCSDEEPPSQILPRRKTIEKRPKKRTTEDALLVGQEDDPEAKRIAFEERDIAAPLTTNSPVKNMVVE